MLNLDAREPIHRLSNWGTLGECRRRTIGWGCIIVVVVGLVVCSCVGAGSTQVVVIVQLEVLQFQVLRLVESCNAAMKRRRACVSEASV